MFDRYTFRTTIAITLFAILFWSLCRHAREAAQSVLQRCRVHGNTGIAETNCDYIVANKARVPTIYVGGYYMRTLVDGYEILGDQRYLDTALAYSDYLLGKQLSNGFWATGYGAVYLADTGSALGLFISLYKHAGPERRKKFLDAVLHYANSIQKNGMIHPNGAFGTGWGHVEGDTMTKPIPDQYTLSSALTGGEIFTWIYRDRQEQVSGNRL